TRTLSPTDEAALLARRVQPLVRSWSDLRAELRETGRPASGTVRVSASVSFGQTVIAPLIAEFRAAHPGVSVDLDLTDRRVDLVAERVDVAIRHGALEASGLVARRLMTVRYGLYAVPGVSLDDPDDLAGHALLSFPYAPFRTAWHLDGPEGPRTVPIAPAAWIGSAVALRDAARAGAGIAVLPDWLPTPGLVRLLPGWTVRGAERDSALWQLTPSRDYRPARVTAFIEALDRVL
ncbi:MAG: substrate binding domain-containing protein, partial [Litorimonas sp.]